MTTLNDNPTPNSGRGASTYADNRNIVITGFMATGKTTVGKLVAEKLGRPFIDTDEVIAQRAGKSIPEIFAQDGEAAFRQMERDLVVELASQRGLVIATGGGMVVDPVNRDTMIRSGKIFCLDASPEEIERRLAGETGRPLAGNWRELYEKRREAYAVIPSHINTLSQTPEILAERIKVLAYDFIEVRTPEGRYQINFNPTLMRSDVHVDYFSRAALVTNTTLAALYGDQFRSSFGKVALITIPDGEQYKTLETVAQLYVEFVTAGLDRVSLVYAFGGGVVGDTVGFAAATYMRGVNFIQIPTSLLSMVDSSVGGKVGVDLPQGKNLVGAFKQPKEVIIDPKVLDTLPEREWRCGMAEVIKHGLLADPVLLDLAPNYRANIDEIIRRAIQVKVDVVEADPYEKGIRAHLNLGHTFGHAIEQVSDYAVPHGEAVGMGLIAAAVLSARLGMCPADLPEYVEGVVGGIGLPTRMGSFDPEAIYAAMATDKKWQGGVSRFVLLEGVGKPQIVTGVPKSDVIAVLEQMK